MKPIWGIDMSHKLKAAIELIRIASLMIMADNTRHYQEERQKRRNFIEKVIGNGKVIYMGFTRNKKNPSYYDVNKVYDNGIIEIVNPFRGMDRIVTTKISRPGQIYDAFNLPEFVRMDGKNPVLKNSRKTPPASVLKRAKYYVEHGWNNDQNLPPENEWEQYKKELRLL